MREEFDRRRLPLYWLMTRNPRRWWALSDGALNLLARAGGVWATMAIPHSSPAGSSIGRRGLDLGPLPSWLMATKPASPPSRTTNIGMRSASAARVGAPSIELRRRAGPGDPAAGTVLASAPLPGEGGTPVQLKIEAEGARYRFAYAQAGG